MFKPPFRRRAGLFYAVLALLAVWVAVLLTLYFVTVFPNRHLPRETELPDHAGRNEPAQD